MWLLKFSKRFGEIVYITNAGYFKAISLTNNPNTLTLAFLYKQHSDTGVLQAGQHMVPSGVRGKNAKLISTIIYVSTDVWVQPPNVMLDSQDSILLGAVVYVEVNTRTAFISRKSLYR